MNKKLPSDVFWYSLKDPEIRNVQFENDKVPVVIVGGGMTGLSCAQKFLDADRKVVVIEKYFCGAGASGKTSGFITPDSEIELSSLLETYGPEQAKHIWEFVVSGVENIRQNIKQHSFSCDFQKQDSLFIANTELGFKHVKKEHAGRKQLDYTSTLYDAEEVKKVIGSEGYKGAVRYPETFGMNSYLYCQALKELLRNAGVRIYEQVEVQKIVGNTVITSNGQIQADTIIVCADRFIPDLGALKNEIYHVQTFLGMSAPLTEGQVKTIFPEEKMMVWDTDLVYNYFRLTGDNRLLIGGGDLIYTYAKNITTNTPRFRKRLKKYITKKFPSLEFDIEYIWAGMLGVSKDLLPIIGPDKKNTSVYYVGAASGLPWAAALGRYAADRIISNRKEFDDLFSPDRSFAISGRLQSVLRNPATFAVSNGIAKYL